MKKLVSIIILVICITLFGCGMIDNYADRVTSQLSAEIASSNSLSIEAEQGNQSSNYVDSVANLSSVSEEELEEVPEVDNMVPEDDSLTSEEANKAVVSEDNKEKTNDSNMVVIDKPLREYVDERSESQKATDEILREQEEKRYALAYPDAPDLVDTVNVEEYYANEEVIIFIQYSEVFAIPREASLTTPSGEKYPPCWTNDSSNGMVYWRIQNPELGEYTIQLSANIRYGKYWSDALDSHNFSEMFIERTEITYAPGD